MQRRSCSSGITCATPRLPLPWATRLRSRYRKPACATAQLLPLPGPPELAYPGLLAHQQICVKNCQGSHFLPPHLATSCDFVLGPDNVPVVTTTEQASRDVPAAVFSALTHSRGPETRAILEALAVALGTIDTETAAFLAEFIEVGLGDTVGQQIWKVLMATVTYPYVSELRAKGRAEGQAEGRALGEAAAILRVLDRRGIAVDEDSRQRIESCRDLETLGTWLDRSLTATKASDLFD